MNNEVLILLAAYKGEGYIRQMIDSIIDQDCDCWRLILSDDGEETTDILQEYAEKYPKNIEHYRSGKRFGSAQRHFLHLLETHHDAKYIMFCDQDDVWHRDKISKTLAKMKQVEKEATGVPILVYTDLRVVDSELNEIAPSFMQYAALDRKWTEFRRLMLQNVVTGCTVMINRALAEKACEAPISCDRIVMHDWWLALIAAGLGKLVFLNEATIDYRQHGNNVLGVKRAKSATNILGRIINPLMVRKELYAAMRQTGEFVRCFGDSLDDDGLIAAEAFSRLPGKNKIIRLATYVKYNLWLCGFFRVLGQIAFC